MLVDESVHIDDACHKECEMCSDHMPNVDHHVVIYRKIMMCMMI